MVYSIYVSGSLGKEKSRRTFPLNGKPVSAFIEAAAGNSRYSAWEACPIDEAEVRNNILNRASLILFTLGLPPPIWECAVCGRDFQGRARFLSYVGLGGAGLEVKDPCCEECFSTIKWCGSCYNYVVPEGEQCPEFEDVDVESHMLQNPEDMGARFGADGRHLEQAVPPPCVLLLQKAAK
jgi:hypothetical protein